MPLTWRSIFVERVMYGRIKMTLVCFFFAFFSPKEIEEQHIVLFAFYLAFISNKKVIGYLYIIPLQNGVVRFCVTVRMKKSTFFLLCGLFVWRKPTFRHLCHFQYHCFCVRMKKSKKKKRHLFFSFCRICLLRESKWLDINFVSHFHKRGNKSVGAYRDFGRVRKCTKFALTLSLLWLFHKFLKPEEKCITW